MCIFRSNSQIENHLKIAYRCKRAIALALHVTGNTKANQSYFIEVRDYDIASKSIHNSLAIRGYCFSALISLKNMCLNNSQNAGNLLLFVFSHVGVKMPQSFAANTA